jgi:hypothetical protein
MQFVTRVLLPVVRDAVCDTCALGCCQRCSWWHACFCLLSEMQFVTRVLLPVDRDAVGDTCAFACCQRCIWWHACFCLLPEMQLVTRVLLPVVRDAVCDTVLLPVVRDAVCDTCPFAFYYRHTLSAILPCFILFLLKGCTKYWQVSCLRKHSYKAAIISILNHAMNGLLYSIDRWGN